jgi:hypothetical protein
MRRGQHPARADQDPAAAAARAGAEIAAEMDDGVPGELSRPDFLDAAVDRADNGKIAFILVEPRRNSWCQSRLCGRRRGLGLRRPRRRSRLASWSGRFGARCARGLLRRSRQDALAQPFHQLGPISAPLEESGRNVEEHLGAERIVGAGLRRGRHGSLRLDERSFGQVIE